ncbi:MAG: Ldh family oxidoreductase, partial [Planctomycetes bacterium]|nr:Ldh family oxidoreductase [Planctomycetota bacterium]
MPDRSILPDTLESFLCDVYRAVDMPVADAKLSARLMVQSNLWGVDSHGVLRLPPYVSRLRKKVVNPRPEIRSVKPENVSLPVDILNGDDGLGYVVGHAGMRVAIDKARRFGIGIVVTTRSNHYGAASLYSHMASDAGLIGFSTTNVIPSMGMTGAAGTVVGNNPIALSVPIPDATAFTIDIGLSVVAMGKLFLAQKKGEKIPTSWAVARDGSPTDDPTEALAGLLLPLGMHKGLGLALAVEIITGALAGEAMLDELKSKYKHPELPSLNSHLFAAVDPSFFVGRERFSAMMATFRDRLKRIPMRQAGDALIIPGEIEARTEA